MIPVPAAKAAAHEAKEDAEAKARAAAVAAGTQLCGLTQGVRSTSGQNALSTLWAVCSKFSFSKIQIFGLEPTTPPPSTQYGKEGLSKTSRTKTKFHRGIRIFPSRISSWAFSPHETTSFLKILPNPYLRDLFSYHKIMHNFPFPYCARESLCARAQKTQS